MTMSEWKGHEEKKRMGCYGRYGGGCFNMSFDELLNEEIKKSKTNMMTFLVQVRMVFPNKIRGMVCWFY